MKKPVIGFASLESLMAPDSNCYLLKNNKYKKTDKILAEISFHFIYLIDNKKIYFKDRHLLKIS